MIKRILPFAFLVVVTAQSQAQDQSRAVKTYSMESGLSHNVVYGLAQDETGFLWAATESGLNRFDGLEFASFFNSPFDSQSLGSNNVNALVADGRFLWVGTWGSGLNRFDRFSHTVTRFLRTPHDSTSISDNRIQTLFKDSKGNLWIGTYRGGLNLWISSDSSFESWSPANGKLSSARVWCIEENSAGLWCGTDRGLSLLTPDNGSFTSRSFPSPDRSAVRCLLKDPDGRLWVGTDEALYIAELRGDELQFRTVADRIGKVNDLFCDSYGTVWAGTQDRGLLAFRPASTTEWREDERILLMDIRSLLEDRSHNLWVGLRGGGLARVSLKKDKFTFAVDRKAMQSGNLRTWSFAEDEDGGIFISIEGRITLTKGGVTQTFRSEFKDPLVRRVMIDPEGMLWMANNSAGLERIDPKSGQRRQWTSDPARTNSLSSNRLRSLAWQRAGTEPVVWIGTFDGLNRYHADGDSFTVYRRNPHDPSSLIHNEIRTLYVDRHNDLWIGTNGGLSKMTSAGFESYRHVFSDKHSLSHDGITCIIDDPDTTSRILWIGTDGGGINRMDVTRGTFDHFSKADGLPSDVVAGLLFDNAGQLWVSSNFGLCRINPEVFRRNDLQEVGVRVYDRHDGLPSPVMVLGSYLKTSDGRLLFGTVDGPVVFRPENVIDDQFKVPVVMQRLRTIMHGEKDDQNIQQYDQIVIKPQHTFFSIKWVALDYSSPENNRYAYRLEGFDPEWTYCGSRNSTSYSNLEPGEYTFRVKATNSDGVWNEEGASVKVTVEPPFYKTWWFRVMAVLISLAGLGWLYRIRIHYAERRSNELAELVRLRTEELEKKNLQLAQLNEKKNEFIGVAAHDLRNPLGSILNYMGLIRFDLEKNQMDTDTLKEDLDAILKTGHHMNQLIGNLLDAAAIESGKLELSIREESYGDLLRDCIDLHARAARQKNISLELTTQALNRPVQMDALRIREVLDNLLSNAIKYTFPGGHIHVVCTTTESCLKTAVEDTGQGLSEADLKNLFVYFKPLSSRPTGGEMRTGLGLAIVKKIVEMHGGSIEVRSTPGKGSTFSFILPLDGPDDRRSLAPSDGI